MDTIERYRQIIETVLQPYAERRYSGAEITNETIFDPIGNHYLVTSVGWQGYRRVAHNLLHLDIIGGKIWVQKDGTEDGIAEELETAGIPKHDIVLAFRHAEDRAIIPEYAVS
jgi:hypothetical protein